MQTEIFQISNRVSALEVKHGEFSLMHDYTNTKLEVLEELLKENQVTLHAIKLQLATRIERIKTLKAALITLATLTTALSSLHIKNLVTTISAWLS